MDIRVLVVDDVARTRWVLRAALTARSGFDVVGEAANGHDAVSLSIDLAPDVVVLDLGLPDLAGREVLTRLRTASPSSGVVVFSGVDQTEQPWVAEHAEGYVTKGADLDYLVGVLRSVGQRRAREAELELPEALTSAGLARRFVADTIAGWDLHPLIDDAVLVVGELTANAVTHASSGCRVRVTLHPSGLRIHVIDSGAGTPDPQAVSNTDEHGRGLLLVTALAAAWGLEAVPGDGKAVWAELPLPG